MKSHVNCDKDLAILFAILTNYENKRCRKICEHVDTFIYVFTFHCSQFVRLRAEHIHFDNITTRQFWWEIRCTSSFRRCLVCMFLYEIWRRSGFRMFHETKKKEMWTNEEERWGGEWWKFCFRVLKCNSRRKALTNKRSWCTLLYAVPPHTHSTTTCVTQNLLFTLFSFSSSSSSFFFLLLFYLDLIWMDGKWNECYWTI